MKEEKFWNPKHQQGPTWIISGTQSDRKWERVCTCRSTKRRWQMDVKWVAAARNSCTKFPVWMRKQRKGGREAGMLYVMQGLAGSGSGVLWQISTLDTSSLVILIAFSNWKLFPTLWEMIIEIQIVRWQIHSPSAYSVMDSASSNTLIIFFPSLFKRTFYK